MRADDLSAEREVVDERRRRLTTRPRSPKSWTMGLGFAPGLVLQAQPLSPSLGTPLSDAPPEPPVPGVTHLSSPSMHLDVPVPSALRQS